MKKVELLQQAVEKLLSTQIIESKIDRDELIITVDADNMLAVMKQWHDDESTCFEQCQDLCGVDYSTYHDDYVGLRFAVVYHLLSVKHNWRIRVKIFAKN